ncbi:hypothetical protein [Halomonas heilongjiangensis]|uniref:Phage baseplate protein n=1 Tax=Halomonas heilongjiangensis TaxID=1387883 RepID=A0A2N7TFB7_9GAMM|nr:hypothetical protein [Halomonas heilongjiangensis]PMR66882.1 hypothetical protein C1H66_22265 [Halomonas heilongjiangensis]PXX91260.1 hypothetical protein CR158_06990 [Halomonas heilongjiangensis]
MVALTAQRVLSVWEHGLRRHPIDRALLLYALADPDLPSGQLADAPLGDRNAALLRWRQACFGTRLEAWLDCPACGERMEFEIDASQWPSPPTDGSDTLEVRGHRFQRPTSRHLARLTECDDEQAAARRLLLECAVAADALPRDEPALAELLEAVDVAMDAADPWADLSLAMRCPACGHDDDASFDIAGYLWEEIDSQARRLLDDIHALAQAYGWTEPVILALSETRRAAYLARVQP